MADLSADHFSAAGAKPDFGDRTPVLDRLLDLLSPGPAAGGCQELGALDLHSLRALGLQVDR